MGVLLIDFYREHMKKYTHVMKKDCLASYPPKVSRTLRYVSDQLTARKVAPTHWSDLLRHPEIIIEYYKE